MSAGAWSRSSIDRLGDRLRDEDPLQTDTFQALQDYFATLEPFADEAFSAITDEVSKTHDESEVSVTRRRLKTLTSIREKLLRQSTKLSQMQDIVGCRIVVPNLLVQNRVVDALANRLGANLQVQDRRLNPRNGYRAVHAIVRSGTYRFEIQIRTNAQDAWASGVEKIADKFGNAFKYGGGPAQIQSRYQTLGDAIFQLESTVEEAQHLIEGNQYAAARSVLSKAERLMKLLREAAEHLGDSP